jgi:hypothetical protein
MQFSKDSALNFYSDEYPSISLGAFLIFIRNKIRRLADDYDKQTFATFHPPIELNSNRIVGLVYKNKGANVKHKTKDKLGIKKDPLGVRLLG